MKSVVVALLCCAAVAAEAQVYKCKEGATTVFSSVPCGSEAVSVQVRPATGAGVYDPDSAVVNRNIATGRVGTGMTPREVRAAWGAPSKINTSLYASGSVEQWVYYRDAQHIRAQYVHFRNGVVSSVTD